MSLFMILPGLVLVGVSFTTRGDYGELIWSFSTENYERLLGFSVFGWTADYLLILWRSVVVAFVTTLISVTLSYPLCFFIAARPARGSYIRIVADSVWNCKIAPIQWGMPQPFWPLTRHMDKKSSIISQLGAFAQND